MRQASGTSTVYQRRRRTRTTAYGPSTSDVNIPSNRATAARDSDGEAGSTTSERIDRLVREVSRDSENPRVNRNNLTGAEDSLSPTGATITLSPPTQPRGRPTPSWIPEMVWNRRRHDEHLGETVQSPTSVNKSDEENAYAMSLVQDARAQRVADELDDIEVQGKLSLPSLQLIG